MDLVTKEFVRLQLKRIGLPDRIIGALEATASDDLRARIVGSMTGGEINTCYSDWQAEQKMGVEEDEQMHQTQKALRAYGVSVFHGQSDETGTT